MRQGTTGVSLISALFAAAAFLLCLFHYFFWVQEFERGEGIEKVRKNVARTDEKDFEKDMKQSIEFSSTNTRYDDMRKEEREEKGEKGRERETYVSSRHTAMEKR